MLKRVSKRTSTVGREKRARCDLGVWNLYRRSPASPSDSEQSVTDSMGLAVGGESNENQDDNPFPPALLTADFMGTATFNNLENGSSTTVKLL